MDNYYTVSQYAKLIGKDPGNIRRKLINGELKGEKLGNQWMICKDSVYPDDKRVKNGNYRNWRKQTIVNQTNPNLLCTLKRMCAYLSMLYGNSLERVVLYGSCARGEDTSESDVDLALILKHESDETVKNQMIDLVVDYELKLSKSLSVVTIEYDNYMQWNKTMPFYKNIEKEGIVIWKKE